MYTLQFTTGMILALRDHTITNTEFKLLGRLLCLAGKNNAPNVWSSKSMMLHIGVFRLKTVETAFSHLKKQGIISTWIENRGGKRERHGQLNLNHEIFNDALFSKENAF